MVHNVNIHLVNNESPAPGQASTSAFAALRADGVIIPWGAPDCGGHFRGVDTVGKGAVGEWFIGKH